MYTTCIFCSRSLGGNDVLEEFPVGRSVAFDEERGRLWAVCRGCGRWNLAPIEERWEAVEEAEKRFRDTRTRVHSENIGLAGLRDGTRLIRVGRALPGELAAWRYGRQLVSRRNRNLAFGAAAVATGGLIVAGMPLLAAAGLPMGLLGNTVQIAGHVHAVRERRKVVLKLPAADSPTGAELIVRRLDMYDATLTRTDHGEIAIELPEVSADRIRRWSDREDLARPAIQLRGDPAHSIVTRALVSYNRRGAREQDVNDALTRIAESGGASEFSARVAGAGARLSRGVARRKRIAPAVSVRQILGTFRGEIIPVTRYRNLSGDDRPELDRNDALALEIALHEEVERRALEGELAALEAAWREAEEIARIADRLPD